MPTDNNTTYSAGTGLSLSSNTFSLGTSGVTAGSYGPSADVSGSNGATINVPYITVDTYGRITSISNKVYTSVNTDTNTDTKNTAGSTNSTSKLYIIGATSQAANPQTYSYSGTYIQNGAFTTSGAAKAASFQATSDIRKKFDLVEIKDIDLSTLKAFEYNLNGMTGRFTGLIAQEVEKVLPTAVKLDDEGFLSLDYNAIVAVLVNKVNRLEARISELENK